MTLSALFVGTSLRAQTDTKLPDVTLSEFNPTSQLKGKRTDLKHAKFGVIDCHGHFGFRLRGDTSRLKSYVETMNRHRIALSVSLDAKLGDVESHLQFLKGYSERFLVFTHIDFQGKAKSDDFPNWSCNQPGFVRNCCEQLREAAKQGIVGVKFFKQFGLGYRNRNGQLIKIDDPIFDPFWKTCGELKMPVLIHTGDPAAFFEPITPKNERYEELSRHPDWSFHGRDFPSRIELLEARNRVIARHPETVFIGAHMAGCPEDLSRVEKWLEQYPNLYVEIASRIAELGRQPYSAREFILKHQDRILFGTDGPWPELRLTYYWRFLETMDEYFPYSEKVPQPQGLWAIYGLYLPDELLRKIYFENFLRVVPAANSKYKEALNKIKNVEED